MTAKSPATARFSAASTSRAASLRTGIKKRDQHLRSADFFDVEKFPDISVVVTGAEAIDGDNVDLRASVTVKGTTLPIELPATCSTTAPSVTQGSTTARNSTSGETLGRPPIRDDFGDRRQPVAQ